MKNLDKTMSNIFNTQEIQTVDIVPQRANTNIVCSKEDIKDVDADILSDAEYARQNMRHLIEKGTEAIEEILMVARHSEHPRAYEVASNFIKSISDMNRDLLHLHKQKQSLVEYQPNKQTKNSEVSIDKAVFVGSTTDLMKIIKQG